jgi:predicted amidophosphoribosyltransferase
VRAWKEHGLRPLAELAAELVAEVVPPPAGDVITYIPPDGDRSLRRGHHPARRLAGELGSRWQLESRALLGRARPVSQQTGLPLAERRRNVRGAFVATAEPPRKVILVDDVYTTGATVGAAASALRAAGASSIRVVTFARAVR